MFSFGSCLVTNDESPGRFERFEALLDGGNPWRMILRLNALRQLQGGFELRFGGIVLFHSEQCVAEYKVIPYVSGRHRDRGSGLLGSLLRLLGLQKARSFNRMAECCNCRQVIAAAKYQHRAADDRRRREVKKLSVGVQIQRTVDGAGRDIGSDDEGTLQVRIFGGATSAGKELCRNQVKETGKRLAVDAICCRRSCAKVGQPAVTDVVVLEIAHRLFQSLSPIGI